MNDGLEGDSMTRGTRHDVVFLGRTMMKDGCCASATVGKGVGKGDPCGGRGRVAYAAKAPLGLFVVVLMFFFVLS